MYTSTLCCFIYAICIGYTPRARLLSDLATECRRHKVAKSLGNQARGVQPACTMTTQNSKIRLISEVKVDNLLINLKLSNLIGQFELVIVQHNRNALKNLLLEPYCTFSKVWKLSSKLLNGSIISVFSWKLTHLSPLLISEVNIALSLLTLHLHYSCISCLVAFSLRPACSGVGRNPFFRWKYLNSDIALANRRYK